MWACGPVDKGTYSLACARVTCGPTDVWTVRAVDMWACGPEEIWMLGTCVRCVGLWMKEENFRSIFFLHQGPVVQKPINAKAPFTRAIFP